MNVLIYIVVFLISANLYSQDYKDDISVVQFSAPFTQKAEVSLKQFNDHNIHTLCITKQKKFFDEEKCRNVYQSGQKLPNFCQYWPKIAVFKISHKSPITVSEK